MSKVEYIASKQSSGNKMDERSVYAANILFGLGGKDNITDVTHCATRLRISVIDDTLIEDASYFKNLGAHGLVHNGNEIQVIVV